MEKQKNRQMRIKDIINNVSKYNQNGLDSSDILLGMQFDLFPLLDVDLVNINNEQDYNGYYAFNVPIPAELIKEALLLAKESDNNLSRLVLKYPYIQLIVEYWIINKIYNLYLKNPKLIGAPEFYKDYKSFNNYLGYHYIPFEEYVNNPEGKSNFGYTATFESLSQVLLHIDKSVYKTLSYKPESGYGDYSKEIIYNIADMDMATNDFYRNTDFSLYDFIYDLFYYGMCKLFRASFQNGMISKLLPIYREPKIFDYKAIKLDYLYGSQDALELFPAIERKVTRLISDYPTVSAEESLIVKSLDNQYSRKYQEKSYNFQNDHYNPKLGAGYDELWEVSGRAIEDAKANSKGETDLYVKWFYTPLIEPKPPIRKYPEKILDNQGNVIKEKYEYTYKETEELLGSYFYYTHNFHVKTPCFYRRRMLYGYEWDRMSTLNDSLIVRNDNILYSSLYFKYAGLQLITTSFIGAYGRW